MEILLHVYRLLCRFQDSTALRELSYMTPQATETRLNLSFLHLTPLHPSLTSVLPQEPSQLSVIAIVSLLLLLFISCQCEILLKFFYFILQQKFEVRSFFYLFFIFGVRHLFTLLAFCKEMNFVVLVHTEWFCVGLSCVEDVSCRACFKRIMAGDLFNESMTVTATNFSFFGP